MLKLGRSITNQSVRVRLWCSTYPPCLLDKGHILDAATAARRAGCLEDGSNIAKAGLIVGTWRSICFFRVKAGDRLSFL